MATKSVVDQIVNSLAFVVEATLQNKTDQLASTSNITPLNLKIRVRKKDESDIQHGVLSIPKYFNQNDTPEKIRLINSDQTIVSFNVFMETDSVKKPKRKHRKYLFGGCLGTQYDDDDEPYLLNTTTKKVETNTVSKSEGILKQNFKISKTKYDDDTESIPMPYNKKYGILGKCKPGGCLDPPFSEDKYSYKPVEKREYLTSNTLHDRVKCPIQSRDVEQILETTSKPKPKEIENRSILSLFKANSLKISIDTKYSDSIITYPPETSSSSNFSEQYLKNKQSNEEKRRKSTNESTDTFFSPAKKTSRGKHSYERDHKTITRSPVNAVDLDTLSAVNARRTAKKCSEIKSDVDIVEDFKEILNTEDSKDTDYERIRLLSHITMLKQIASTKTETLNYVYKNNTESKNEVETKTIQPESVLRNNSIASKNSSGVQNKYINQNASGSQYEISKVLESIPTATDGTKNENIQKLNSVIRPLKNDVFITSQDREHIAKNNNNHMYEKGNTSLPISEESLFDLKSNVASSESTQKRIKRNLFQNENESSKNNMDINLKQDLDLSSLEAASKEAIHSQSETQQSPSRYCEATGDFNDETICAFHDMNIENLPIVPYENKLIMDLNSKLLQHDNNKNINALNCTDAMNSLRETTDFNSKAGQNKLSMGQDTKLIVDLKPENLSLQTEKTSNISNLSINQSEVKSVCDFLLLQVIRDDESRKKNFCYEKIDDRDNFSMDDVAVSNSSSKLLLSPIIKSDFNMYNKQFRQELTDSKSETPLKNSKQASEAEITVTQINYTQNSSPNSTDEILKESLSNIPLEENTSDQTSDVMPNQFFSKTDKNSNNMLIHMDTKYVSQSAIRTNHNTDLNYEPLRQNELKHNSELKNEKRTLGSENTKYLSIETMGTKHNERNTLDPQLTFINKNGTQTNSNSTIYGKQLEKSIPNIKVRLNEKEQEIQNKTETVQISNMKPQFIKNELFTTPEKLFDRYTLSNSNKKSKNYINYSSSSLSSYDSRDQRKQAQNSPQSSEECNFENNKLDDLTQSTVINNGCLLPYQNMKDARNTADTHGEVYYSEKDKSNISILMVNNTSFLSNQNMNNARDTKEKESSEDNTKELQVPIAYAIDEQKSEKDFNLERFETELNYDKLSQNNIDNKKSTTHGVHQISNEYEIMHEENYNKSQKKNSESIISKRSLPISLQKKPLPPTSAAVSLTNALETYMTSSNETVKTYDGYETESLHIRHKNIDSMSKGLGILAIKSSNNSSVPKKNSNSADSISKKFQNNHVANLGIYKQNDKIDRVKSSCDLEFKQSMTNSPVSQIKKHVVSLENDMSIRSIDLESSDLANKLNIQLVTPEASNKVNENKKYNDLYVSSKSSLKRDTIVVDFGFQSFINDKKERVIKSINTSKTQVRIPDDTITLLHTEIRPYENEIRIPIDTENDMMCIQIKRNKSPLRVKTTENKQVGYEKCFQNEHDVACLSEVGTKKSISRESYQKIGSTEEIVSILNSIYDNDLVPLQNAIVNLKQEVEMLASLQILVREKSRNITKSKPIRMLRVNQRCGCRKK